MKKTIKTNDLVEQLARMSNTERHSFIEALSAKWPTIANELTTLLSMYSNNEEIKA